MENSTLTVIVLLGLVGLRWVILGIGAALIVRPVTACPACAECTLALHKPWLRRLARWLEWRFCPGCGWQGPARRVPDAAHAPGPKRTHQPTR